MVDQRKLQAALKARLLRAIKDLDNEESSVEDKLSDLWVKIEPALKGLDNDIQGATMMYASPFISMMIGIRNNCMTLLKTMPEYLSVDGAEHEDYVQIEQASKYSSIDETQLKLLSDIRAEADDIHEKWNNLRKKLTEAQKIIKR